MVGGSWCALSWARKGLICFCWFWWFGVLVFWCFLFWGIGLGVMDLAVGVGLIYGFQHDALDWRVWCLLDS